MALLDGLTGVYNRNYLFIFGRKFKWIKEIKKMCRYYDLIIRNLMILWTSFWRLVLKDVILVKKSIREIVYC